MSKSPIIDQATSMTENDVLRLFKGCVRRNMCPQALYCLNVLERGERYFDRIYAITTILFFELGLANDFPDLVTELDAVASYGALRAVVAKMCCRGTNHMAFVPDMLARIAGYSEETTLVPGECAACLHFPTLMLDMAMEVRSHSALAVQTLYATVRNLMETTDLGYIPAWRAVRCARLLLFLVGSDGALWHAICELPRYYVRYRGLAEWIGQCHTLYRKIPAKGLWDKRRSILAATLCGLLYGVQEEVSLEAPAEECAALRPELFPAWFYSTQEAPSTILCRAPRPDAVEPYLKRKYPRCAEHWADLHAELHKLSAKMSLEARELGVSYQSARFARLLTGGSAFALPPTSPACCPHYFIADGSIVSSAPSRANPNLLAVRLLKSGMASIMSSSLLCYNGPFRTKYGSLVDTALHKTPNLELLYGGPFVDTQHIMTLLSYLVMVTYTDLFAAYPAYEPYLQTQLCGRDVHLLTVNLHADWAPVTPALLAEDGSFQVRQMWTLGWIYRYLLEQATHYDPADFAFVDEGDGNLVALWLFGLYPDERPFVEADCIHSLMEHSSPELYESCMRAVEGLFVEATFLEYVERVIPKKRAELAVYRSMVMQLREPLQQRYAQLASALPIGEPASERPLKKQKIR